MRRSTYHFSFATFAFVACCFLALSAQFASADSLSLLTDLEYDVANTQTTTKATEETVENKRASFSQLYNLDFQKEIFPNLKLNAGGLFDDESSRTKTDDPDGSDNDSRRTAVRPFFDLQFTTSLLTASAGYRKSEIKQGTTGPTNRTFSEEYSARLNWDPVELPEVDLTFTRNLAYDQPLSNDRRIDTYQLRSRYEYGDFRFNYDHTTNDSLNKINDFKTLANFDEGTVRFSRTYQQGKVSVNSSLRANRQQIDFSGVGDRDVPVIGGVNIVNDNDANPITSDPDNTLALSDIALWVGVGQPVRQVSFGRDFGSRTAVSKIVVTISGAFTLPANFSWSVYIRNNATENWTLINPGPLVVIDAAENQFELAFATVETRFIKIVTTQLNRAADSHLRIDRLEAFETLPPDTSGFTSTDVTGDLFVNWQMTDKTSTGYDILYREQRSDSKKTLLSTGVRLRHVFNDIFIGNMRLQRSESRDQGENPDTNHSYSAGLTARYLDTFDQSLTYSFSHQNDEDSRTNISNAVFLRSNMDLYRGWSLFVDNGYNWQNPAEGEDTNTTFVRLGSNIVPNRWLNLTVSYGIDWTRESGLPVAREQDGSIFISWVPTSSLSLAADFRFSDQTGADPDSTAEQQYFINWSPFRDGTLLLSLAYGQSEDDDDEKTWNLSPTLRWQINRKTLLTFAYAVGERDDRIELVEFENISLALRFFY